MKCNFLEGDNIKPSTVKQARALKGKRVTRLCEEDIDKSGRGYYFPRGGYVEGALGRDIIISGEYISISRIREMILS